MATIEGFCAKSFRVLRGLVIGKRWTFRQSQPRLPMTAVIGKSGIGKLCAGSPP